jgi:hypothetical protein
LSQSILSGMSGTGSWTLHRRGSALALSRITPLCFKSSIFKHLQSSLLSSLLIACWLSHFRDLQHLASGDETLPSKNGAQLSNPGKPVHASLLWTEFALASKITAQKTEYNPIFLCSEKGANILKRNNILLIISIYEKITIYTNGSTSDPALLPIIKPNYLQTRKQII